MAKSIGQKTELGWGRV